MSDPDWRELSEVKQWYQKVHFDGVYYPPHYMVTKAVMKLKPKRILEFGSCWGKNWVLMRRDIPAGVNYVGVDVNKDYVKMGADEGIDILRGDEKFLKNFDSNSFDVVFTCSVINHITPFTAKMVMAELKRIAANAVVLCECTEKDEWRWYKHDYEALGFKDTGKTARSEMIDATYRLFVLTQ